MNARVALAAKFDQWAEVGLDNVDCPVARIFDHVGDRWSMLLASALASGPQRFNALSRMLPEISRRLLTQTLRRLEADGLLNR